jgi:hypothetical protein
MHAIKLIDAGHGDRHRELGYAAGDAKHGWFLRRFPEMGKVRAAMCGECGRIVLHGEPHVESPE